MKKIYILIVLLVSFSSSFANFIRYDVRQSGWRWRNNDGAETAATWKAEQNAAINYHSDHGVVRLRIEITNTSLDPSRSCEVCQQYTISMNDSLQFSTTPLDSSSWKNIGLNASLPFVMANVNGYVAQDEATTPQITNSSYVFSPGKIMTTDSVLKNITVKGNSRSEFEWVIRGTSNLLPNTTYYFRQRRIYVLNMFSGMYSTLYPIAYPSLTTATVLPIMLSSFTADNQGGYVRLEWSTASEENNDYFNVQRSTDGQTWQTINKVNSKGNSPAATHYAVQDNGSPLTGIIYYRLQQYNKDGKYSFSDVRAVKMLSVSKAVVTVSPNPVTPDINFKLESTAIKNLQAILTDLNGRILHAQTFINVQVNNLNKLDLKQQPAPGIYILKLTGDGLSESIKVVVQ